MSSNRVRIQNALVDLAKAGRFPVVTYQDGRADEINEQSPTAEPAAAIANETQSGFSRDRNRGRSLAMQRESWRFQLLLGFNSEVSFEDFEQDLMLNPPLLERTDDLPQVILELQSASYEHPPQQGASTGTKAVFEFTATVGRN